ncbi:hypothetical protein DICA4_A08482 [Diutina catenulata]
MIFPVFLAMMATARVAQAFDENSQISCASSVSGSVKTTNQFMTPSLCAKSCGGSPYTAVQGEDCYCLSSKPSDNGGTCNTVCPGYGSIKCGGQSSFSIFQIGEDDGATEPSSSKDEPSSTKPSNHAESKTSASPTKSEVGTTVTDSPSKSTQTVITTAVTSGDSVVTIYQTSNVAHPTSSSSSSSKDDEPKKKSNTGAIVGGVVGGVAGGFLLALAAFFFIRWRRNRDYDEDDEEYDFGPEKGTFDAVGIGRGNTAKGSKRSRAGPLDMPMANPFDHPSDPRTTGGVTPNLPSDPRMNPVMMGRSRLSEDSLADNADYSRKILHVANPDGL